MSSSYAGGTGYASPQQNSGAYGALPDQAEHPMYPSSEAQNGHQAYPSYNAQNGHQAYPSYETQNGGGHQAYPSSNGTAYAPYSIEAFNAHKQKDMSTNGIEKSNDPEVKRAFGLSHKWQKRLYW